MTTESQTTDDPAALDRVLETCVAARSRVREAGQALSELASAIKEACREQKTQTKEVQAARATLAKLQAISL